jgi:DNA-binding NarL/FixJ family response regulator
MVGERRRVLVHGEGLEAEAIATLLVGEGCDSVRSIDDGIPPDVAVVFGGFRPEALGEYRCPVVAVVDDGASVEQMARLVMAGVDGIVHLSEETAQLLGVIDAVSDGEIVVPSHVLRRMVDQLRRASDEGTLVPVRLTPRERSVLECIVRGESVKQTARHLELSPKTIENVQSRLYRRLRVRNRAQAVVVALELGLV